MNIPCLDAPRQAPGHASGRGERRTHTRLRVQPSGQVGSSSATRMANMCAMHRPRACPAPGASLLLK